MALSNHSFAWTKNVVPLYCLSGFFDTHNGHVPRETPGLGRHAVFRPRVDFGAGFFPRVDCFGNSGSDRLRGGACILTEGHSLFVPCGFLRVIISLQLKDNADKGALLHKVHYSDANRHKLHMLDRQAEFFYFVNAFAQSDLSKTWLETKTGMEGWRSSWWGRAARSMWLRGSVEHVSGLRLLAHCTALNFGMTYNTKLVGCTVFASLATLFLSRTQVLRCTALCFSVLRESLDFCLQSF